ncbi:hypothetical protein [Nonomuraea sp. NPDC050643]|uniref:hypothetical protein n=1 Tax=Nonomuraea sp. NPDC050643 TaxID=3155660 RepID=UPI0033C514A0
MQRQGKRLAALGLLIGGLPMLAPGTATAATAVTVRSSGVGVAPPGAVAKRVQAGGCVSPAILLYRKVNPPYSFTYKSTTVGFRQWQPSDYSYAKVVTRDKRIRVYLESKKGRKCGPFKVRRDPGTKKYTVQTLSLPNRSNSVRICVFRYGVAGYKCGAWKKEGSDG